MLDRPFSDVCSTVSCWALIFSVILPSMQVMGVKITTPATASPTTSDPQQQQHHLQKHSHQQQQHFLLKTTTFSLTVYLDPTTFQQTLPPMTFLSDPSLSTLNNKNKASSAFSTSSSPKSYLIRNSSWKDQQQDQQLPNHRLNQRTSVIGRDVAPSSPARGFSSSSTSSSSSDRKRFRSGTSRTVIVDQSSVLSRSSLFLPLESDTNNHDKQQHKTDATAAEQDEEEEGRIDREISKGPRRLSRHRYPHVLIRRLYNNNQRLLEESGSRRRMVTMPKTATTTRKIEVKERPSRLQRLLLLNEQRHDVDENVWQNAVNNNNNNNNNKQQQQQQQEQGRVDPLATRDDNMFYFPTDRDLADIMNFILDDDELWGHFLANDKILHSRRNEYNDPSDSALFETGQQPQHQQSTSASSSSSSSSFVSPSLSGWTQTDIDIARALWDYWEELDAMDLIQAQLESQLDEDNDNHEDNDNIDYETPHPCQGHPRQRPGPQPFKSTLWKGRVKALIKDGISNMPSSPLEWTPDSISGPMMRFPFSGPMPIMPQKWIALMPCPVEESAELDLGQTGRKTPTLPLDASAIVFYATTSGDCRAYAEIVDDEGGALPPIMVLDALSAKKLVLTLDSLSYGTTAMASLSKSDTDTNATATQISATPISTDDNDKEETIDVGPGKDSATLDSPDSIEKEELFKTAARPIRRLIVISMPEIASMVDSFTARAVIQARRVLVNLGLDTQDTNTDEQLVDDDDHRERGREDADYSRPLAGAMLLKNGGVGARKTAYFGPEAAEDDSHGQDHACGQDKGKEKEKDAESTSSSILQRHSKTRTRPIRLSQREHLASTRSQLLDQVQSLMLLKEYPQYSRGHQSLHHHLAGLQQNNDNNPSITFPINTTLPGKVTMVLMSTACGIGVSMFGALLFVVALKVRLFQSRRSNNSGSGLHPLRHPTAAQQQQAHQQMRESGLKKVIPLGVLESYEVQTVLQTSNATMVLTTVSGKSKAKMTLLSKGAKAVYAEDVIEMEEGLEDAEARANARRLRLERRMNRGGGSGQLRLGRDIEEEEEEEGEDSCSGTDEDDYDDDDDVDEDADQEDQDGYQDHEQHEEEENDDQVVPEMRSSRDGGAMDMEQITAAIIIATRQGSYRRVSYSRQGHLNDSTSSLSSSYSSSSSSSSGSNSSANSSSMERALTSSFSSSLSRSENPQGCTHSITHSHEHRRTRSNRRRKMKEVKGLKETKKSEKLPFANANAQTMCSICLAEYEVGEQVRTLPCYHQFHQVCIDPWLLNVAALCPICKRDLFPSPLVSSCGSAGPSLSP